MLSVPELVACHEHPFRVRRAYPFTHNTNADVSAKRFSTDHEWVSFDSATNIGTIGITDYAQKALGDVVFIELPALDSEVPHGGELTVCETYWAG